MDGGSAFTSIFTAILFGILFSPVVYDLLDWSSSLQCSQFLINYMTDGPRFLIDYITGSSQIIDQFYHYSLPYSRPLIGIKECLQKSVLPPIWFLFYFSFFNAPR